MNVALFTHAACLAHDTGPGHPESPSRLRTVLDALAHDRFALLDRIEAPRATRAQLERVHRADLVAQILDDGPLDDGPVNDGSTDRLRALDPDTIVSPGSAEAALRAAGAVCAAVDRVMAGPTRRAFCAVRPPGHHATAAVAMGFCLFNNVAVGAAHAIAAHGVERVAIVDFDVHHGNGTQDIFHDDPSVLYVSSHQSPLYPGSGRADERGCGNVVNRPLAPGSGGAEFRAAWDATLLPAIDRFAPQLVLVSAGFDAHRLDPLANLNLDTADFGWISERLVDLAERHARGRLVSSLEGGYSLTALRESVGAHVGALLD